ncbi:uncharacterized protein AMSG_03259 [Thecamonas trahens ATCC 50062]|uniref:Ubiquitin carboxyl-terminal hydrolase n=1 Tax=Thecamonas trahens ATCC 50062 TaxID=461836 RepID=A0A0L0D683_THETB|nr:hypothetical protein AMSG_03259 [Thecamonas trahens ATCC 50062]KNC46828.1 hypothetical protein AMSG_03259 [Thecamonas trahens ATCC 50062]|eukprot:XP_013760103.1 hypothetical protein AMSG_03259 [Thecamonas trahens ATCC 50062]
MSHTRYSAGHRRPRLVHGTPPQPRPSMSPASTYSHMRGGRSIHPERRRRREHVGGSLSSHVSMASTASTASAARTSAPYRHGSTSSHSSFTAQDRSRQRMTTSATTRRSTAPVLTSVETSPTYARGYAPPPSAVAAGGRSSRSSSRFSSSAGIGTGAGYALDRGMGRTSGTPWYAAESPSRSSRADRQRRRDEADPGALSKAVGESERGSGEVGLSNLGNTCFMNSILQCLSNCGPLRNLFLSDEVGSAINTTAFKTKGQLAVAFGLLLREMWQQRASCVAPRSFKREVGAFAPRFMGFSQQDSQEFLRFLLDGLHEDLNRVRGTKPYAELDDDERLTVAQKAQLIWDYHVSRDDSIITDLFRGQLISTVTCMSCSAVSQAFDPFLDISLPIPVTNQAPRTSMQSRRYGTGWGGGAYGSSALSSSTESFTLGQCLEAFTEAEVLDGDEKYYCSKCKKHRKSTKELGLFRLPAIMVLHLKRFSASTFRRSKLTNNITFPLDGLDLGSYLAPEAPSSGHSATYSLFAVSNHMGSLGGGHYTAYARSPDTDSWFLFDDARVSSISPTRVGGPSAYLLFYMRDP